MLSQAEREAVVSTCRCTGPGFDTEQAGRGCNPRPQTPCCTDGGREGWCPHEVCGWHCKWARPYWGYRNHTVNGALSDTQRQQTETYCMKTHTHAHRRRQTHTCRSEDAFSWMAREGRVSSGIQADSQAPGTPCSER